MLQPATVYLTNLQQRTLTHEVIRVLPALAQQDTKQMQRLTELKQIHRERAEILQRLAELDAKEASLLDAALLDEAHDHQTHGGLKSMADMMIERLGGGK